MLVESATKLYVRGREEPRINSTDRLGNISKAKKTDRLGNISKAKKTRLVSLTLKCLFGFQVEIPDGNWIYDLSSGEKAELKIQNLKSSAYK